MLRGIDYLKWEFEGGHAMLPTWRMEVPRLVVFLSGGYGGQDSNRLLRADCQPLAFFTLWRRGR